jgi:hypothetical protein
MNPTLAFARPRKIRPASSDQRIRRLVRITRYQLAGLAGVPVEDVQNLEEGLPVMLERRIRIRKVLWAIKDGKCRRGGTSRGLLF